MKSALGQVEHKWYIVPDFLVPQHNVTWTPNWEHLYSLLDSGWDASLSQTLECTPQKNQNFFR